MAEQISWMTLEKGTRVVGSDGEEIGTVAVIVADRQQDIFSGIAISSGLFSGNRFVPADMIDRMEAESVQLTITSGDADARLDTYED